ncbi:hypothetical protein N7532_010881 [Penicillium argentinense]|uniref:LisH domain-containing protein n=1 Tax=Penicillium argentinense TaxID=1131581 RepID=A0A9W9EQM7_9EURO|nr:uncharacterized protein N7532_010881 [Penicillium argentinense]KAJ5086110.1 hypothetical protein N7532_010881 [Penicillium argentinense]
MAPTTTIEALTSALVARFLRTNNYSETLQAFIREAGLAPDVGQSSGDDTNNWSIQSLLEEKMAFDHSVNFERYGDGNKETGAWSEPAPNKPTVVSTPTSSNLLAASVESWEKPCDSANTSSGPFIISTGADRQVHLLMATGGNEKLTSFSSLSDSPVLSYVSILGGRFVLMTNMSGHLLLQQGSVTLDKRKDHAKYAVKVVAHKDRRDPTKFWIATAGWDSSVLLYRMHIPDGEETNSPVIGEPVACIKTRTNPESLLFVPHVDTSELFLLVSRRDSTYVYYYEIESVTETESGIAADHTQGLSPPECHLLGHQNLAPHSNAWVAFSPAHMALSPHDPGVLAVATSTLPHMKVIIVRLLFPSREAKDETNIDAAVTQASQALEALALQNREDAAILVQANTLAPQTAYSTPQIAWRPDGSGIWVNGDDGVIRGIETKTGKVVAMLKGGHEPGSKVRSVWSGRVEFSDVGGKEPSHEEWVISGGFDKRLIVWKV